jgi:hypothetical protein
MDQRPPGPDAGLVKDGALVSSESAFLEPPVAVRVIPGKPTAILSTLLLEFLYMPVSYDQADTKHKLLCRMISAWLVAITLPWRAGREKLISMS